MNTIVNLVALVEGTFSIDDIYTDEFGKRYKIVEERFDKKTKTYSYQVVPESEGYSFSRVNGRVKYKSQDLSILKSEEGEVIIKLRGQIISMSQGNIFLNGVKLC